MNTVTFALEIAEDNGKFRITLRSETSMALQQAGWHKSIEDAAAQFGPFIPDILPRMYRMKTKTPLPEKASPDG